MFFRTQNFACNLCAPYILKKVKAAFGCNSNPKRPFYQTAICRALTAISLNGRLPSRTRQGGGLLSPFPLSALIIRSPLLYHAARAVSTPSNYPESLLPSDLQLVFSTKRLRRLHTGSQTSLLKNQPRHKFKTPNL